LGQYQKDASTPPIPEYRVKIKADVAVPETKIKPIGLSVKTNSLIYKNGDRATIEVKAQRTAQIAIFNITADDRVVMLFPNEYEQKNIITREKGLVFPQPNSRVELIMQTLPNHKRDTEALMIVAMDDTSQMDMMSLFTPSTPMAISAFFDKYARIADFCEDVIVTYEIINRE
ncbi:MAG: DUF4384 domain-containing protein, partial [Syntrophorhabdaceae bacterium]|nr:DUF4384 domain-containing protein [Syntrophorhabdaceae bacterium]